MINHPVYDKFKERERLYMFRLNKSGKKLPWFMDTACSGSRYVALNVTENHRTESENLYLRYVYRGDQNGMEEVYGNVDYKTRFCVQKVEGRRNIRPFPPLGIRAAGVGSDMEMW